MHGICGISLLSRRLRLSLIPPNCYPRYPRVIVTVIARARDDLLVLLASMSRQRRCDVTVVADALSYTFTTRRTTPGIDVGG